MVASHDPSSYPVGVLLFYFILFPQLVDANLLDIGVYSQDLTMAAKPEMRMADLMAALLKRHEHAAAAWKKDRNFLKMELKEKGCWNTRSSVACFASWMWCLIVLSI